MKVLFKIASALILFHISFQNIHAQDDLYLYERGDIRLIIEDRKKVVSLKNELKLILLLNESS